MNSRILAGRRGVILMVGLIIAVFPSTSSALTLACKPGITKKTFAKKAFVVPQSQAVKLEGQLTDWGERQGLSVSGVGIEDPGAKPPLLGQTTILQSQSFGTVLEIQTSNRSDTALVAVGNNCWAPQEDWRPYWRQLNEQLSTWGYRPKSR